MNDRRAAAAAVGAAVSAMLLLGACSTANEMLQGKKIDYKSAGQLPTLEIPPDLTTPSRDNRYVVPESARSTTYSAYDAQRSGQPRAGQLGVLPNVDKMRVERSGSQRWLVVSEPPEKLWPVVKDFWQEVGFLINVELPDAGVMETDWAENRAKLPNDFIRQSIGKLLDQVYSTSERDKFRTRLERGAADGTTEIYVSHRGMIEVYTGQQSGIGTPGQTMWQPRPPDPELEAEFLRRLMVRLGTQEDRAKELLASAPQGLRASLTKQPDGADLLQVTEPFDRAWRRVGLALDRVGFTVEDRDRQKGLYFVRYADPEAEMAKEKPGLLSRLAFWKSDDKSVKAEQFQVLVTSTSDNSQVQVLGKDGMVDKSKTSQRILSLLHEQLK
jgi:outer membrane protein assembly factor BamC